jgi:hypothetical protein
MSNLHLSWHLHLDEHTLQHEQAEQVQQICITATKFYTTFYIVTANTINATNKETTVRYSSFLPFEDRFFSQIRNVYKPPHLNIHVMMNIELWFLCSLHLLYWQ